MIIKKFVRSNFGNEIILHSVKVTPALNIYIGRLEFRAFEFNPEKKISGFAQQIEFDWSLFLSNELASLRSAVINLEDKFILDNSAINISRNGFWDFNTFQVLATTDLMKVDGLVTAESIDFNSNLDRQRLEISEISTQLKRVALTSGREIIFKDISVELDRFDLSGNLLNQSNTIEIGVKDLRSAFSNVTAKEVQTKIENRQGLLTTVSFLKDISASNGIFFSNSLSIQVNAKIDQMPVGSSMLSGESILMSFEDVSYENYKANNFEVEALLKSAQNPMIVDVRMTANDLFLQTADFFIGELPSVLMTNFVSLDLGFGHTGFKMNVDSSIAIERAKAISTQILSEFVSEKELLECLAIKCSLSNGFFDYEVMIGDSKLVGSINCTSPHCDIRNVSHTVESINTNDFFKKIIDTRLFNPLLILYLQTNIMSGEATISGHKKTFQ